MEILMLENRRVLVVGASSGIGRAFALAASRLGAQVACSARTIKAVQETAAEAGGGPAIVGDVTSPSDCDRVANEAARAFGGIDAVFYTPAPGYHLLLRSHDLGSWESQFHSIVVGASNLTRAVLPHLSSGGVVAYLSSLVTRWPPYSQYGMLGYASCKAALETMIKGWQAEEPQFRFVPVVIGPTAAVSRRTQHEQDPALEAEIRRRLTGAGVVREGAKPMDASDLGRFLAEFVGLMLAHPGISAREVVLDS